MFQPEFPNRPFCEDSIFNTLGGITGKPDLSLRAEGIHCLDQSNGTNADHVILPAGCGIIFFDHVGHQAQIMADEGISGRHIAALHGGKSLPFLCKRKRAGKASALQMQRRIPDLCGSILQTDP